MIKDNQKTQVNERLLGANVSINSNKRIAEALSLPNGARFYKCALQVNPYVYLKRHSKATSFKNEDDYNAAIIKACQKENVEVIAVTDHHCIRGSESLINAAEAAGIKVFPAFEASTKDGIHFICLFDPSTPLTLVQAKINDCGIHDDKQISQNGKYDATEFLAECQQWGAICIAAHITLNSGLLVTLEGQPAIRVWRDSNLLAGAIPGSVGDLPQNFKSIIRNENPDYRRVHPIAVLNAADVSDPSDLKDSKSYTWIKMSDVSVEGLRQSFLDPSSRIRLATDPVPEEHAEFVAVAWEAGFLDGVAIHLNENLNVLVGGRGTGKSTVVESLRYAIQLEPIGEDAKKAHEGIIRNVLKSGTKISLLVRSYRPDRKEYLIERTIPNPPTVKDESGNVLTLTPRDILPRVEIFGQREISELAKDHAKRTLLLNRFVEFDSSLAKRKEELRRELNRSRTKIIEIQNELMMIEDRLGTLPIVEETLKRYQDAGLEQRLKEQSLLVREERIIKTAP